MSVLVHISKAENEKSILRSGIKPGKHSNIVYFMPHLKEFLISHQWARELKRFGIKNFIAVDFKIPNNEEIWFGRYTDGHKKLALNKAIRMYMDTDDKLGYEFFIERKIEPKEILKTRSIRKPMGWRYEPEAHGKKPCPCPMCIQSGGYKTYKLKEKTEYNISRKEAKEIISVSNDADELYEAVTRLQGKSRKESPEYLARLISIDDEYLLYSLVELIAEHRHPKSIELLKDISKLTDEDARELAINYLKNLTISSTLTGANDAPAS